MKRFIRVLVGLGIAAWAGLFIYRRFTRREEEIEDVAAEDLAPSTPSEAASAELPDWPTDDEVEEPLPVG
jgi:hypothetical protein